MSCLIVAQIKVEEQHGANSLPLADFSLHPFITMRLVCPRASCCKTKVLQRGFDNDENCWTIGSQGRGGMTDRRTLISTIADEDTNTGLLLAGVGQTTPETQEKNFFVYREGKTTKEEVKQAFDKFTKDRDDIAILLINQHVAELIRSDIDGFTAAFPAVLEIPSKDHPYDPEKDSVLKRVKRLYGE